MFYGVRIFRVNARKVNTRSPPREAFVRYNHEKHPDRYWEEHEATEIERDVVLYMLKRWVG